jgi:hypothetical protein
MENCQRDDRSAQRLAGHRGSCCTRLKEREKTSEIDSLDQSQLGRNEQSVVDCTVTAQMVLWVHHIGFLFCSITMMNRLFKNKRKKESPEPSSQDNSPGFPTDIAAGPVSTQAESNINPECT